jgi:hypothetical protein
MRYAAAFDAELSAPSLQVRIKTAGLVSQFKAVTSKMGPGLALASAAPDLVRSYQGYQGLGKIDKEVPESDGFGAPISESERESQKKKKKKQLGGEIGEGIGAAAGGLAGFLIPGAGAGGFLISTVGGIGASMLGSRVGKSVGEALS